MSHMSHSSTNKDRIAWIDLLETIAILWWCSIIVDSIFRTLLVWAR